MSDVDPNQEGTPPQPPPAGSSFSVPPNVDAWLTDRWGAGALALVIGTACFVLAYTIRALGDVPYRDEWKYRAQTLAQPSYVAAGILVIAIALLQAPGSRRADVRRMASMGVLILAIGGVLAMLFGMISDLAYLGDSFNS